VFSDLADRGSGLEKLAVPDPGSIQQQVCGMLPERLRVLAKVGGRADQFVLRTG